ncbi:MAG: T9SS type A sorting domain-containing protein, partial [Chitinophagaceae bacterium]
LLLKAVFINGQVQLHWATANESNSSHFEIERSMNGRIFTKIGEVDSRGNSMVQQRYEFADLYPFFGKNYYRLRQVDIDGHAVYSYMVAIQEGEKKAGFSYLYPNPVNEGSVKIIFRVERPANYIFQMFDIEGKLMLTRQVYCIVGINEISLDVSVLPRGVFTVRINNGEFKSMQLVKVTE